MIKIFSIFTLLLSISIFGNIENEIELAMGKDSAEIEKKSGIKNLNQTVRGSENPDISFIIDVGAGYFINDQPHFIQGGHSIDHNGFSLQGVELAVSHSVDPYFKFDMNFQFVGMHIEEVYITTLALPFNLQARFGMMNGMFGRENNTHLHALKLVNYSLMHNRFMSEEHFSGLGGEFSVLLPTPWYSLLLFQLFDTKSATYFRSTSFATIDYTKSREVDGLEDFLYLGRFENFFELTPSHSLYLGFSGAWGQSRYVPDNRVTLYGADLYYKWRDIESGLDRVAFSITGEFILRDTQFPGDSVRDYGGYLQFNLQTSKEWYFVLRGDYNDSISGKEENILQLGDKSYRGSFGISYQPTHFSRLRLQYDIGKVNPDSELYHAIFFQIEGVVGAHGAHKF